MRNSGSFFKLSKIGPLSRLSALKFQILFLRLLLYFVYWSNYVYMKKRKHSSEINWPLQMENLNQLRVNILLDPSRGVTTGEPAEPKGSLKFLESRLWFLEYYSSSKKIMWLRTCPSVYNGRNPKFLFKQIWDFCLLKSNYFRKQSSSSFLLT